MLASLDIWRMVAGIAIFLLGMSFLEEAVHKLAGRPFKLFLKQHTSNKIKAIAGGAVVTAILQSSSVVNLMVLAFVGAGVIKMKNALAIILGANLGTTFCSWIIVTVGFKWSIESFALPVTGIAGIVMVLIKRESRWHTWSKLLLGLGFLFVGLDYMKTGIEEMVKQVDLGSFAQYPLIVFLIIGLLITSLIQSSSATVAIVLSALNVHAISLLAATAIVLGSEIGTTLKVVLASIKGPAVKKQVAAGNLLFNLLTAFLVLLFLQPINHFITTIIGIKDNLLALVFFQSLVNVGGIVLFFPFLDRMGRWLEKRFVKTENDTLFIHQADVADTELAMAALEKETRLFIHYVSEFVLAAFDKPAPALDKLPVNKDFASKTDLAKYEYIKHLHGEMNGYCTRLRNNLNGQDSAARLEQLIAVTRNAMYAAKSLKDAWHDIEQLRNSSNNIKYEFYRHASDRVAGFHEQLLAIVVADGSASSPDALKELYTSIQQEYTKSLRQLYKEAGTKKLTEIEFSTLINFNREMYTSLKASLFATRDYLLEKSQADDFDELPEFKGFS